MKLDIIYEDGSVSRLILDDKCYSVNKDYEKKYIVLTDGVIILAQVSKVKGGYMINGVFDDDTMILYHNDLFTIVDADTVFDKLENAVYYSCGLLVAHGLNSE